MKTGSRVCSNLDCKIYKSLNNNIYFFKRMEKTDQELKEILGEHAYLIRLPYTHKDGIDVIIVITNESANNRYDYYVAGISKETRVKRTEEVCRPKIIIEYDLIPKEKHGEIEELIKKHMKETKKGAGILGNIEFE